MAESDGKVVPPEGLRAKGQGLWDDVTERHELGVAELAMLGEACRIYDRLEQLDLILRGDVDYWAMLVHDARTEDYVLKIDGAMAESRQQQNVFKQLLVALRLPDAAGKVPQRHGARGAYVKGGKVSSLDKARERAEAKRG